MKKILILLIIGIMFSSEYSVGETISLEHQYIEFPICYGEYENEQFKLADLNGELNGGNYKVIMIGMDATWCSPCFALIPDFDMIVQNWSENNDVFISNRIEHLDIFCQ